MDGNSRGIWTPIVIVFLAGSIATALVPLAVPILAPISKEFHIAGAQLGWVVSFPTLVCAIGALAFGIVVDRIGDVRILLIGMGLVILGDAGVSLAPDLPLLYAARLFQGAGYVCLSVGGPAYIQRTTTGDTRRAAMAFWAAHTPLGFAAAVLFGSQLVAAGLSWRLSFTGHALVALIIGLAVFALPRTLSAGGARRSTGTRDVLTSYRPYAVAIGAGGAAMLQVSVMVMLPSMLGTRFDLSGPQSAMVVVAAMVTNWLGAMIIVTTALRRVPQFALPVSAVAASILGIAIVSGLSDDFHATLAFVLTFSLAIGVANALVWSLIPTAVPFPEASGATAGLITQGSFLGVLIGPPTFFWAIHESPALLTVVIALLAPLMITALIALRRPPAERQASDAHDGYPATKLQRQRH